MRLRKIRSDASEATGVVGERHRPHGRGWGPFSGGQLTIIFVTLAIVIGFPIAASGVISGSNVFVTNAKTGTRAVVSSKGALSVAGSVTVNGTIAPANPVDLFTTEVQVNVCHTIAPPAGHVLVITSVHESIQDSAPNEMRLQRSVGSCPDGFGGGGFSSEVLKDDTWHATVDSQEVTFPSGLVIPTGRVLEIDWNGDAAVTVNGYLLPASSCPTFAACLGGG
jgi:hypothetical protein